jgi:hypothetical protein
MCPTLRFLTASRLHLYGYAVAAVYAVFLFSVYNAGTWILDTKGMPIYTDFACAWIAALEAMHGQAASLYDPAKFVEMQAALVGTSNEIYPNWPYPPTFLLILAPFAVLPYLYAFIAWDTITLLGCVTVVHAITRRPAAIALALACPFTAWNFLAAHNGFLTASLLGASLLSLERQPVLAGVFVGCLTCKPQFGVLFPIALVAARQWRTIASAGITALPSGGCLSRRIRYRCLGGISSGTCRPGRPEPSRRSRQQLGISSVDIRFHPFATRRRRSGLAGPSGNHLWHCRNNMARLAG